MGRRRIVRGGEEIMTEIYKTPKHLHIQECDTDGNVRTVKYYREDIINDFVVRIARDLQRIQDEADSPQMRK